MNRYESRLQEIGVALARTAGAYRLSAIDGAGNARAHPFA